MEPMKELLVFDLQFSAKMSMNCIAECIERYGVITVADINDLCFGNIYFIDSAYGWLSIDDFNILLKQDGDYSIIATEPKPIDR